jgi:HSP20 family molecular chaperone IbpA
MRPISPIMLIPGNRRPNTSNMTKLAIKSFGWPSYRSSLLPLLPSISSFFDYEPDAYAYRLEDGRLSLEVSLPGFKKDQVSVEIIDSILYVKAKADKRSVSQSFSLGRDTDVEQIEATLEDGMLTVWLSRVTQPEPKKTVVSIK